METQRCPMCGRPNPPELEVCQYCQARLKPLWAEPSTGSSEAREAGISKSKPGLEPEEPLLPDWLIASRGQMSDEEPPQSEERGEDAFLLPPEEVEIDNFLGDLFSDEPAEEKEDVPEWLQALRGEKISEPQSSPLSESGEQGEPLPFWLGLGTGETEQAHAESASAEEKVPPFTESPFEGIDFDSDLLSLEEEKPAEIGAQPDIQPSLSPFEGIEPFLLEEEKLLSESPSPVEEKTALRAEETAPLPAEGDWTSETPPWLEALPGLEWEQGEPRGEEMPPEFLQGVVPPFVEADEELSEIEFPEWLNQVERSIEPELEAVMDTLTPPAIEMLADQEEGEIVPKEVEESHPQEDIPIEVVGPLHGLRGVLPAEPLVAEQKKPSKALSELLVTDKQRAQAELFLRLIEEEGKPKPIPAAKRAKPHTLWRALIFLALVVAATIGYLLAPFSTPPQELSVGVFDAMQAVNQLPAQAPVLLIVDLEGSDFAEMQATTGAMLDQMMIKGAFFVLVSANQNGALQADRLLREVSRLNGHHYQPSVGWVNLGYLPGGAAGMQAFVQSLTEVMPTTIDGDAAWQSDRLKNIRTLSDFNLVVVITEDSTRARQWLEQMKGHVPVSRLIFAVSAQVEPILRPYYEANPRQVQSVLAGIRDGAIYETQAARRGWAMQLWDAYTFVVMMGIALIFLGSLVYALFALLAWRKGQAEREGR